MNDGLRFTEWLQYTRAEAGRWRDWLEQNPAALEVPVGPAETYTSTVRGMLMHIFFCDYFYAELLSGKQPDWEEYERIPHTTLDELFAVAASAHDGLAKVICDGGPDAMSEIVSLGWPKEHPLTGTRRKMLAHVLLHGARHWAQVATAVRQHGFKTGMEHDLLFSNALP